MDHEYENYYKIRGNNMYQLNTDLPQYLLNVLPQDKESRILDIGCGNGNMLYALKKRGYKNIQGIDLDGVAVKWVIKNGIPCKKINVMQYRPDMKFDFITLNHVLEHFPKKEVIQVLMHIRENLLCPKGKIMIRVPNAQAYTGCYWAYEDFTHETLYTAGSLEYVLKCAGYKTVQYIDPDGIEDNVQWEKRLKKFLLYIYDKKIDFWNYVTGGAYHKPSPRIYTWELKAIAEKRTI